MFKALSTAASGMSAQQTNIDVIAHNMANVNTTGFHRMRAQFQDLLYQTYRAPGSASGAGTTVPVGFQVGQGVRAVATETIQTTGSLTQTGNPLDIAIEGPGFLQITRPSGDVEGATLR